MAMNSATASKWTPFGVALDLSVTGSNVTRKTAKTFTVKIAASWVTNGANNQTDYGMTASSGGSSVSLNTEGVKAHSGSGSFTGTYEITGNGEKTVRISITFRNFNSWHDDSATKTLTFDVNVPAWTSYSVKFNANDGSGAPSTQTKWKDQTLTLSSTKPTRSGYSFQGWGTSSTDTSVNYVAGGTYTANTSMTLYAIWKPNEYTVTYNANGGTGAPSSQIKKYDIELTLSGTKPTRTNYIFEGWGTSSGASTVAYKSGSQYTSNASITLYAVWKLDYKKPTITGFSVERCDEYEDPTESGTYAMVTFSWSSYRPASKVYIEWLSTDGESKGEHWIYNSETNSSSITSGTVSEAVGDGKLDIDKTYTVSAVVEDELGEESGLSFKSLTLPGTIFTIDFLSGGKGVAFGKPAELENAAEFANNLVLQNNIRICGIDLNGSPRENFQPQNDKGNTVLGWGNYDYSQKAIGVGRPVSGCNTNVYGYDVNLGVANIASPKTFRPYIRKGDSIASFEIDTAGYVTDARRDIYFIIPFSKPIIGNPNVTLTSINGFRLRQNGSYTHGSSANTYVKPNTLQAIKVYENHGLFIKAEFNEVATDDPAINNAPIGVYWHGVITFS